MKEALREELQRDLQKKASDRETGLQTKVTDRLEAQLGGLRQELDEAVNRVTAEALKRKAAQLGPDQGNHRRPAGRLAHDRGGGVK